MKLVADESVDFEIIRLLRDKKFTIVSILENYGGAEDEIVLSIANDHQAILITEDKDFGELVFRLKKQHYGIMLIRLSGLPSEQKALIVYNALQENLNQLTGNFAVLSEKKLRIRLSK